jgi:hypothetical protein
MLPPAKAVVPTIDVVGRRPNHIGFFGEKQLIRRKVGEVGGWGSWGAGTVRVAGCPGWDGGVSPICQQRSIYDDGQM